MMTSYTIPCAAEKGEGSMHTHQLRRILTLSLLIIGFLLINSSFESAAAAGPWYVAPGGNDSNDCLSPITECASINAVLAKPTFIDGDSILVASGTYTNTGGYVVSITKDVTLSGGWDSGFTTQDGFSVIDGEDSRSGIYVNRFSASSSDVSFDRFVIMNSDDEGVYIHWGDVTITASIIVDHPTGFYTNVGTLDIYDSVILDNGRGFYINGGAVNLNNSTVSGNGSPTWGGAFYAVGSLSLNNTTVSGNSAGSGGGIYDASLSNTVVLQNSIVAGNSATSSGPDCSGMGGHSISSTGYNIIGDVSGCTFSSGTGDQTNTDPLLGPLVEYPEYYPLSASSPAVDAGNPGGCNDHLGSPLLFDQRGVARSGVCDIGAYEYTTPGAADSIIVISGSPQSTSPDEGFTLPLQAIVLDSLGSPVDGLTVTFTAPASGPSCVFDDSVTNVTTAVTDEFGLATSALLTANGMEGAYQVNATVPGVAAPADFDLRNLVWYVSTSGNDTNDCQTSTTTCASLNGVLGKPGFTSNGLIYISADTFTGLGNEVVLIDKDVRIKGGWDGTFSAQDSTTIIDGESARQGLKANSGTTATMEHVIIENGYGPDGGGIFNEGTLTLSDCAVRNSTSYDTYNEGGGIYNDSSGILTLNRCEVIGNKAYSGGGIYNNGGSVSLNNSAVSGNRLTSGSSGGGIKSSGTLILNNSTVSGNRGGSGGGVYGNATLNNSTITNNIGSNGGGFNGSATMQNSIIAGNDAIWWPDCYGTVTTLGYNLIENAADCTFTPAAGDLTGVDPKLGPLINSPGYHPLASDSPAIDAGNPAGCAGSEGLLDADQRGASRVGVCDIGAYEYTSPGPADHIDVYSGSPQHAPPLSDYWEPFVVVVIDSIGTPVNGVSVTFTAPSSGASGIFADSGIHNTTALTDDFGFATSATFTANGMEGGFVVETTTSGVPDPAEFLLENLAWYVTQGGNDTNDCQSPLTSCATINGALSKAGFFEGDMIFIEEGTYFGTGESIILIDKDARLSGGWDSAFSTQMGMTTIDGEDARRGIEVEEFARVVVERFAIVNGRGSYHGGGVYNFGDLTLEQCIVRNNRGDSGGGINNRNILTMNSSSVSSNEGNTGGGIYNPSGIVYLNNSTISSNTASSRGSAIHTGGTLLLNNSTISGNHCRYSPGSGGIYNDGGYVTIQNSIIAGNTADDRPDCNGQIDSLGYNLIGNTLGCTFIPTTGDLTDIDPSLTLLEDHGGFTLTHGLSPGSVAINAGNPAGCTDDQGGLLSTDQRGAPRVGVCDIGSYEAGLTATKEVTGNYRPGGEVTFTLTLNSEEGTVDLTDVSLTDDLPPSLTYVPGSYSDNNGTGGESGGVITWNGTVNHASDTVITFKADLDPGLPSCSIVQNTAQISHAVDYEFEQQTQVVVSCQICSVSKQIGNPVFTTGTSGSWDELGVSHPSVIKVGSTYMMWYAGDDGTNPTRIGLATSPNGIDWTRELTNPILSPTSAWEEMGVSRPSVLLDGSVYKMWYTGVNNAGTIRIGYATSPDGINWQKYGGNAVLGEGAADSWDDEDVSSPTVIKVGNTYHMWYGGYDGSTYRIGHAISSNGIKWDKDPSNPVLDVGDVGDWDWLSAYSPEITKLGGDFRLWYSGETLPQAWQTGHAESSDGANWTRKGMLIPEGLPGTFDTNSADHPGVILDGSTYKIWYSGLDDGYTYNIGYAQGQVCPAGACTLYLPLVAKDYTPGPQCPPDYFDNFSDPTSGWPIDEDSEVKFAYTNDEYQVWLKHDFMNRWVTPGARASNYTVAVSAQRLSGTDTLYGLLFGISDDWGELYEVIIGDSGYDIWKFDGGWTLLATNTSGDINTGTAWNRIKVIRDGSAIHLYINDVFQTTVYDAAFTGFRRIGLSTYSGPSSSADFRFDDFALYPADCGPIAADAINLEWHAPEIYQGPIPIKPEVDP
jgi:uncharacterized repeat protein (TIGR01451 family)